MKQVTATEVDFSTVTTFQAYSQRATDFSGAAAADTAIPSLSSISITADGIRRIRVTFRAFEAWRSAGGLIAIKIWEGSVGSGTLRALWQSNQTAGVSTVPPHIEYVSSSIPAAGTYTFNVSVMATSGSNANVSGGISPMYLLGELF